MRWAAFFAVALVLAPILLEPGGWIIYTIALALTLPARE